MSQLFLKLADTLYFKELFRYPLSGLLTVTLEHQMPFAQYLCLFFVSSVFFFLNVYRTGTLKSWRGQLNT